MRSLAFATSSHYCGKVSGRTNVHHMLRENPSIPTWSYFEFFVPVCMCSPPCIRRAAQSCVLMTLLFSGLYCGKLFVALLKVVCRGEALGWFIRLEFPTRLSIFAVWGLGYALLTDCRLRVARRSRSAMGESLKNANILYGSFERDSC